MSRKEAMFEGWSVGDKIAAIIAGISFIQAVALIFTYCVMRDTSRRQLRAYVSVDTKQIRDADGQPIKDTYGLHMSNFGQTPAYKVRSKSEIGIHEYPLIGVLTLKQTAPNESSHTLLSPSEPRMITKSFNSTSEQLALIDAGTHALYWWGKIEYEDAFENKHWTTYCYFRHKGQEHLHRWAHYPTGNDADRGDNRPVF